MAYALGSLAVGLVAYLVTLALQSRASRLNLESWGELAFVCAVPATLLVVVWLFGYLGEGGRVSAAATTEAMFEPQRIRSFPMFGFFTAGFLVPASIHVLALKWRSRRSDHDA
jgi:hypothetical protein